MTRQTTSVHGLYRAMMVFGVMALITTPLVAQAQELGPEMQQQSTEVSSEELESFVSALQEVEAIQVESQQVYAELIQEEGLTEQRFNEIHNAAQNPEFHGEIEISDAENEAYEVLLGQLVDVQQEAQQEMQAAVAGHGLEVTRFNEILVAIQQDPNLQQQVQEMLQ